MLRRALFPGSVLLIYGILFIFVPDRASLALGSSFRVFLNILLPLCLVFSLMVFLNFFLKPPHIAEFLGKRGGVKGVLLTGTAGIISMGPIYAWYPLLRELRGRGVRNSLIAIFLGNRAVKPLLLPVLISYFGWTYAVTLALLTMVGSLAVGYTTGALVGDETGISGNELHERKNTEKTIPQKRINLCVSFYPLIYLS
jgi:uncharacterized membrane protein YraQ (UPF0718 family)